MSAALDLLAELRSRGARIRADGEQLFVSPREVATPELLERLRAAKPELLVLLRDTPARGLLAELERHGVRLEAHADGLRVRSGSPAIPRELVAAVSEHASAIRVLLLQREDLIEKADLRAMHAEPTAWRLYSRALGLELWLARDEETAEEVWVQTRLPVLLVEEWLRLARHGLELVRAVLNVRAEFGPRGVALGEIRTPHASAGSGAAGCTFAEGDEKCR
jgi:hypothetical protein